MNARLYRATDDLDDAAGDARIAINNYLQGFNSASSGTTTSELRRAYEKLGKARQEWTRAQQSYLEEQRGLAERIAEMKSNRPTDTLL